MSIEIIGSFNRETVYCTGSFTKLLTTYVCLSKLSECYPLEKILNDENFLDELAINEPAKSFLHLFQEKLNSKFSIRDLCSFYSGLPYTFDLSESELKQVEGGLSFKHHSIMNEDDFLFRCRTKITPVYKPRCKFHYSEISIIFLGYLMEKVFSVPIEDLYQKYVIDYFNLKKSLFSRIRPDNAYCQDLSDRYDYPSIAILDHGFFCYSNGFFTCLNDMKQLLEQIFDEPVFKFMIDITHARAASNRLLNGLTIEMRLVNDDIIYGYEGLSYSGCNSWAYSKKQKKAYLTFSNSEEEVYEVIYHKAFGFENFDKVPDYTQTLYQRFVKSYDFNLVQEKEIPKHFQGQYHRVKINEKNLAIKFELGKNFMMIRNPDLMNYDAIFFKNDYRIKCKDNIHGAKIGLYTAENGHQYFLYDGTLYRRLPLSD